MSDYDYDYTLTGSEKLVGRIVIFVDEAPNGNVTLYLNTGEAYEFRLDGDCCSTSEFTPEGLAAFQDLIGKTIQRVEDRHRGHSGYRSDENINVHHRDARLVELVAKYPPSESDSWHFLVFETDQGHVTVDWRNQSNGYYDGSVTCSAAAPLPLPLHDAALEQQYAFVREQLPLMRAKGL